MPDQPITMTAVRFIDRSIAGEQQTFARDAQRVAEQAAFIAANPPSSQRSVSGDLTRLTQEVADLLRRAAKIEATIEALGLLEAEAATNLGSRGE